MCQHDLSRQLLSLATYACVALFPGTAMAQEFRVETEVFAESSKEPISESLTIFAGEVVYDFLSQHGQPSETTMFDTRRGRIVILDPQRKLQTLMTTDNLVNLCADMKTMAVAKGQESLFAPKFEVEYDSDRHLLTMNSETLTYRAKGVAARHPHAARQFQEFADWYSRLNAIRPANVPPFGRIELNKALAERNMIPEEIERTVVWKRTVVDRKMSARSVHTVNWLISNSDRTRIETVGRQLTSFSNVPVGEFWQPTLTAAKAK